MSVSFDSAVTLQSATSHQCSRDADGDGEGGRNGYPSDSMKAVLTKKFYVAESEDHDQTKKSLTQRKHLVRLVTKMIMMKRKLIVRTAKVPARH